MTVYVRTDEGQLAAYSANSALPRKLRSLLKVIDGNTPLEVYINSLRAFGDVQGVLKSLDMAGLIRPMSQLPPGAARAAPETGSSGANTVWNNTAAHSVSPTRSGVKGIFKNTVKGSPDTQASYMQTRSAESMMALNDPSVSFERAQALARAVDSMSNFVLANAPEHSFMVLKELEQLTNLEQLAVTLGGYEQLVRHLGAPAQEHLNLIKALLRDHL
jgi:hypothetical protein